MTIPYNKKVLTRNGDEVTVDFFPKILVTQNQAGEWKEYKVVELRCSPTLDGQEIFFNTGRMNNEGITIPMTQVLWDTFSRRFWNSEYSVPHPTVFYCTYTLTDNGLIPIEIIYEGESYPLSS